MTSGSFSLFPELIISHGFSRVHGGLFVVVFLVGEGGRFLGVLWVFDISVFRFEIRRDG